MHIKTYLKSNSKILSGVSRHSLLGDFRGVLLASWGSWEPNFCNSSASFRSWLNEGEKPTKGAIVARSQWHGEVMTVWCSEHGKKKNPGSKQIEWIMGVWELGSVMLKPEATAHSNQSSIPEWWDLVRGWEPWDWRHGVDGKRSHLVTCFGGRKIAYKLRNTLLTMLCFDYLREKQGTCLWGVQGRRDCMRHWQGNTMRFWEQIVYLLTYRAPVPHSSLRENAGVVSPDSTSFVPWDRNARTDPMFKFDIVART